MTLIIFWCIFFRIIIGVTLLDSIIGLVMSALIFSIISATLLSFYVRPFLSYVLILIYRGRVLVIFRYFVSLIRRLARNYTKAGTLCIISFPFFFTLSWGDMSFRTASNIFCLFEENRSWIIIFLAFILVFALLGVVKLVGWSLGALRGFFCLSVKNKSPSDGPLKV